VHPDGLLVRRRLGDRLAHDVVREAPRERVVGRRFQQAEAAQRFEVFEAGGEVDACGAASER